MINKALSFIEDQTNLYLQGIDPTETEKQAILGNIAKIADDGDDAGVVITLVNIEEDRISKNPDGIYRVGGQVKKGHPKILVNLYLLFSVHLKNYATSLTMISNVIQCFQSNNYFPRSEFPSLDENIERLKLELYTMNFEQVNHLWSTLGGKYLPSVLYKLQMIAIADQDNQTESGLITEIETNKSVIEAVAP
jgi:hypothetical protein